MRSTWCVPPLPVAADGVAQYELQLRTVKRALARIVGVVEPRGLERRLERGLGLVPHCVLANADFRAIGKLDQHVVKTEITIDTENEVANGNGLVRDLFRCAEHVCVVLRERADSQHAVQCAGRFVAVHLAKFAEAVGQFPGSW